MKTEGALGMRFPRHDQIYQSDVSFLLVSWGLAPPPVGRRRGPAIGRDGRGTPCPSSLMSFDRLFLDRVARQQSPSPLHRQPQLKPLPCWMNIDFHRTAITPFTLCPSPGVHFTQPRSTPRTLPRSSPPSAWAVPSRTIWAT